MNQNINTLGFSEVLPKKLLERIENKHLNDDHYGILIFLFFERARGLNNPENTTRLISLFACEYGLDLHLVVNATKRINNDEYREHIIEILKNESY